MKNRLKQLKPRLGRGTRFEIGAIPPVPFRGAVEDKLDLLKGRLLKELLTETDRSELTAPLRRAANEAASVAWFTPFPLLVFPVLLEEKAAAVFRQAVRQREIRRRSNQLLESTGV